jgi:hypothetical protein
MEKYQALKKLIASFDPSKIVQIENGPILYWNFPEKGSRAFLHTIHPRLTEEEYIAFWKPIRLPREILDFLFFHNGVVLFATAIALDGLRDPFSNFRNREYLPYSILLYQIDMRPADINPQFFIFGTANQAEQLLCYHEETLEVHIVSKKAPAISLRIFPSFDEFLEIAIQTLQARFDAGDSNRDIT